MEGRTQSFIKFLESKDLKPKSIDNYLTYHRKFIRYPKFDQEQVNKFISQKVHRTPNARAFVSNFQKFLLLNHIEFGLTPEERVEISSVIIPKVTGKKGLKLFNVLRYSQIFELENSILEEKYKLMLLLSFFCGLRKGGVAKLRVGDFYWDKWESDPEEMGEARVLEKGNKEGIILIPPKIMSRVKKYIYSLNKENDPHFFLFINYVREGQKLGSLSKTWYNRLVKAGIDSKITKTDPDGGIIKETRVHPHLLRHSLATYLLEEKGLDISEVKEILRHSDISSTQKYIHLSKKKLKTKLLDLY